MGKAEVARFGHSGATHIIHRSYHVEDHCVHYLPLQIASQLTADDGHRMGAISRKALRRGVSHTDFDIAQIANCFPRLLNLLSTSSPPSQDFYTLPLQSSEKSIIISYVMLNIHSIKTVWSFVVYLTFDDVIIKTRWQTAANMKIIMSATSMRYHQNLMVICIQT